MAVLHRRTAERSIEKQIVTSVIVSDGVLSKLHPYLDPNLFELKVSQIVIRWIVEYYSKYKTAPLNQIQDIYTSEKSKLKKSDAEEIELFLHQLSEEYSEGKVKVNEGYLVDQGLQYIRKQRLLRMAEEVKALASLDEIEKAETVWRNSGAIIQTAAYQWAAPLDDTAFVNLVFQEQESHLFRFSGKLGEFIGPLRAGWLIGLMGPMKRGKTFGLQDIAFEALVNNLKTVFISLEMKDVHLAERIYSHISAAGPEAKDYVYPCFDCIYNQDNSCPKRQRTCRRKRPFEFDPHHQDYKPCTICRGTKDYKATTWFTLESRPKLSRKATIQSIKQFTQQFGHNCFRLRSFPAFSANLTDVMNELDILENEEGFVPQVIVIDYADIMAPEPDAPRERRHQIDFTWQRLKGLAEKRNCLMATGSQTDAESLDIETIRERNFAEDIRKLANVDVMMSLNQTEDEKRSGVLRIGLLEHRWKKFDRSLQLLTLQQLEVGQPLLDTEFHYWRPKKRKRKGDEDE